MTAPPRIFDRALHARRLTRAAKGFDAADFLHDRAAQDLAWRIAAVTRSFDRAVVLGARRGAMRRAIESSDAAAKIAWLAEADLSAAMLADRGGARVVADEERLAFAPHSFDLVLAPLALHWANDLVGALTQIRLALKPGGLFLGSLFGGATLRELRTCLTEAELEARGGAASRVSPVLQPADAAGLLQRAGFVEPVADVDAVTVRYSHPLKLLADLRAMGETGALADKPPLPLTRAILADAFSRYAERYAEADGKVPATFEIVALTGWAPG